MLRIYHYAKCTTCRKALAWLKAHSIALEAMDIVSQPPSVKELQTALEQSGLPLAKLFNTSGESYRAGNFKERLPTLSARQALTLLAADGKLIKRPLVFGPDFTLVGFDEKRYAEVFQAGSK
jgi:arsenate reductase (glutaredoxin)